MAGESSPISSSSSSSSSMNLGSLFGSYDKLWDPMSEVYKTIKSSENQGIISGVEAPAGSGSLAFYSLRLFEGNDSQAFQKKLVIVSKNLCEVLNIVLRGQGITVIPKRSELDPHVFYHYLDDFRNFDFSLGPNIPDLDDPDLSQTHLAALIYFLESDYESDRLTAETLLAMHPPRITYELLWLLFKPGMFVLSNGQDPQKTQLYRCKDTAKSTGHSFILKCEYITSAGKRVGIISESLSISPFEGVNEISKLDLVPFELFPSRAAVRTLLEERGRRYIDTFRGGKQYISSGQDMFGDDRRFIIGTESSSPVKCFSSKLPENLDAIHYQLCSYRLPGYSVKDNTWSEIHIDYMTDIVWKEEMLANLVLDPTIKTIIKGFVDRHSSVDSQSLRDVIPGKGAGLIMLFSGPPGTGKTLTAEAVAEATHRLIYRVSPSDLSSEPGELDRRLSDILERGVKWDLVLLLDEADVFLEQRTSFDVKRNSLISIFLRQLENYRGILILTTNRVESFDKALESRVHFNFRFPELNKNLRMQLWQLFLEGRSDSISLREVIQLSEHKLNGRTIKNAVSLAIALAKIQNESLSFTHIRSCLPFIDPSLSTQHEPARLDDYNYASPLDPWMTPGQITDGASPGGPSPAAAERGSKRPRLA